MGHSCLYSLMLMLALLSVTVHGRESGATDISCYNHFIRHLTPFGDPLGADPCTSNTKCSDISLTPACPEQPGTSCCVDFVERKMLYTECNYTFQWSTGQNMGFLLQARIIPNLNVPTGLDVNSVIVGTWDNGTIHHPLNCRNSALANDTEASVPNSVTHSNILSNDFPPTIAMTWTTNEVNPTNSSQSSVYIAFMYTLVRHSTSNYLPYTTSNLVFTLSTNPGPPTTPPPPTNPPTNPPTTGAPAIRDPIDTTTAAGYTLVATSSLLLVLVLFSILLVL